MALQVSRTLQDPDIILQKLLIFNAVHDDAEILEVTLCLRWMQHAA